MLASLLYLALRRLIELALLRRRSEEFKGFEIVVLRHEHALCAARSLVRRFGRLIGRSSPPLAASCPVSAGARSW